MQTRGASDLEGKDELCQPSSSLEILGLGHYKSSQLEVDNEGEPSGRNPGLGQQGASDSRKYRQKEGTSETAAVSSHSYLGLPPRFQV